MPFSLPELDSRDWLVVAATILGPILAVQAQKWVRCGFRTMPSTDSGTCRATIPAQAGQERAAE